MSHADVLLWLILLHCLRCLLRVVYHFHNVHNSRLFYLMSSVYHYSNRHSDNGNWQHKEHDDYDTQESEVGRCTLLFPQFVHLTKKLSCSKTRWQENKLLNCLNKVLILHYLLLYKQNNDTIILRLMNSMICDWL